MFPFGWKTSEISRHVFKMQTKFLIDSYAWVRFLVMFFNGDSWGGARVLEECTINYVKNVHHQIWGNCAILSLVGLVPSCHPAFVGSEFFLVNISWVWSFFSWVLRGSQSFSRGYFEGPKVFLVDTSLVRIVFLWVRRGSKSFSRGYYLVPNFFLVGISLVSFVLKPRIV